MRCRLKDFLSGALAALMLSRVRPLCNFGRRHYEEHSCEVILNLDKWFRRRCRLKKKCTDARWTKLDHNSSPSAQAS